VAVPPPELRPADEPARPAALGRRGGLPRLERGERCPGGAPGPRPAAGGEQRGHGGQRPRLRARAALGGRRRERRRRRAGSRRDRRGRERLCRGAPVPAMDDLAPRELRRRGRAGTAADRRGPGRHQLVAPRLRRHRPGAPADDGRLRGHRGPLDPRHRPGATGAAGGARVRRCAPSTGRLVERAPLLRVCRAGGRRRAVGVHLARRGAAGRDGSGRRLARRLLGQLDRGARGARRAHGPDPGRDPSSGEPGGGPGGRPRPLGRRGAVGRSGRAAPARARPGADLPAPHRRHAGPRRRPPRHPRHRVPGRGLLRGDRRPAGHRRPLGAPPRAGRARAVPPRDRRRSGPAVRPRRQPASRRAVGRRAAAGREPGSAPAVSKRAGHQERFRQPGRHR
jgi:hypothetical protein